MMKTVEQKFQVSYTYPGELTIILLNWKQSRGS